MGRKQAISTLRYWQTGAIGTRTGAFVLSMLVVASIAVFTVPAVALTPLNDAQMSSVNGKGLAFAFDDFRFQMAPTSYFNQVGGNVTASTSFNRGDLYWVGTTISSGAADGAGGLYDFSDYAYVNNQPIAPSGSGHAGQVMLSPLSYPIGKGGTQGYAAVNNPFVLRVRTYDAVGLKDGNRSDWVANVPNTMIELLGPTHSTNFRWAFWGQVDTFNKTTGSYPYVSNNDRGTMIGPAFQNQDIIIGSPTSCFHPDCSMPAGDGTANGRIDTSNPIAGPVFRMYQSMASDGTNDQTLGMIYQHRLSGDWRFSVNQKDKRTVNPDGSIKRGVVPAFSSEEGMYFMDVNTYLPLGTMHYQSLTLDGKPDGNFSLDLTRLPNDPDAYNDFYSAADSSGYKRAGRVDRYYETHGYVRWGNNFPTCSGPNCLSGTGVSNVRFALASDPDGPTLVVNSSNFPAATGCQVGGVTGGAGSGVCDSWDGKTVGNVVVASSKKAVLGAGGMIFVAKNGQSWQLPNNPGSATTTGAPHMLWVERGGDSSNGYTYQLTRDARYNKVDYNPKVDVTAINLGSSRVEGMTIQHLKIETLGAAN